MAEGSINWRAARAAAHTPVQPRSWSVEAEAQDPDGENEITVEVTVEDEALLPAAAAAAQAAVGALPAGYSATGPDTDE